MSRVTHAALAAALLSIGCLDATSNTVGTFPFNFTTPGSGFGEGWVAAIADLPAARVPEVELAGEYTALPVPFGEFTGIRQSGTNISGELFVFHKKWIQTPWSAGSRFRITIDLALLSDQHADCTSGAGREVLIKAGASGTEPVAAPDGQGILRLNLDKGVGASGGRFVQLGDIRNGLTGCPTTGNWKERRTEAAAQPETLTIDADGGFWIFFGTQSTFAGRHEVYFLEIRVTLATE